MTRTAFRAGPLLALAACVPPPPAAVAPAPLPSPSITLRGRAVTGLGVPLEGARVFAVVWTGEESFWEGPAALAGPEGAFEVRSIPGWVEVQVRSQEGDTRQRFDHPLQAGVTLDDLLLVTGRAAEVSGTVLSAGQPVKGVPIAIQYQPAAGGSWEHDFMTPQKDQTLADGSFFVDKLPDGQLWLLALDPRYGAAVEELALGEKELHRARLEMRPLDLLDGRVVDPRGHAVAGALVTIWEEDGWQPAGFPDLDRETLSRLASSWGFGWHQTRTDTQGRFRFACLYSHRPLVMSVDAPGFDDASGVVPLPFRDRSVVLHRSKGPPLHRGIDGSVIPVAVTGSGGAFRMSR